MPTQNLVQCAETGTPTHHVETAADLDQMVLCWGNVGLRRASTPIDIKEVDEENMENKNMEWLKGEEVHEERRHKTRPKKPANNQ